MFVDVSLLNVRYDCVGGCQHDNIILYISPELTGSCNICFIVAKLHIRQFTCHLDFEKSLSVINQSVTNTYNVILCNYMLI